MNAALKQNHQSLEIQHLVQVEAAMSNEWLKVLGAVLCAALFLTIVAVAQVWMRLEIDQEYQSIDSTRIKNARLVSEIEKLQAQYNGLQSFETIEKHLNAAGVTMQTPGEVFYVDPSRATGNLALTSNYSQNGPI